MLMWGTRLIWLEKVNSSCDQRLHRDESERYWIFEISFSFTGATLITRAIDLFNRNSSAINILPCRWTRGSLYVSSHADIIHRFWCKRWILCWTSLARDERDHHALFCQSRKWMKISILTNKFSKQRNPSWMLRVLSSMLPRRHRKNWLLQEKWVTSGTWFSQRVITICWATINLTWIRTNEQWPIF